MLRSRQPAAGILRGVLLPIIAALLGLAVVLVALLLSSEEPKAVREGGAMGRSPLMDLAPGPPEKMAPPRFPVRSPGYAAAAVDAYVGRLHTAYAELWEAAAPEARSHVLGGASRGEEPRDTEVDVPSRGAAS